MEKCKQHDQPITQICTHADCLNFKVLCNICYQNHVEVHRKNGQLNQAEWILTRQQSTERTKKLLDNLEEELDLTSNKAINALQATVSSNIDGIIVEIESIREQIHKLFDKYIQGLRNKFEQKIKQNIHDVYNRIRSFKDQIKQFQTECAQLQLQSKIAVNDLSYQVQLQKSRLDHLLYQRSNQTFQGVIDDDVALHFIGVIQKELDSLVVYDKVENQSKAINSFKTQVLDQANQTIRPKAKDQSQEFSKMTKSWMFYFEPQTKNFHYIDLKDKSPRFKTKEISVENNPKFIITKGSRSIMTPNGVIYYISGCDSTQDEMSKRIYQFDEGRDELIIKTEMYTPRKDFSICATNTEIFLIGGENHKQGILNKSEKYTININSTRLIASLNEQSSQHTSCIYNNQYIIKFGGFAARMRETNQIIPCRKLFELYDIENDSWDQVEFPPNMALPQPTLSASCMQLPGSNQIYIFGGQLIVQNTLQLTNQGFKLIIDEEDEFDKNDQIKSQLSFSCTMGFPITQACTYLSNPLHWINTQYLIQEADDKPIVFGFQNNKWRRV